VGSALGIAVCVGAGVVGVPVVAGVRLIVGDGVPVMSGLGVAVTGVPLIVGAGVTVAGVTLTVTGGDGVADA